MPFYQTRDRTAVFSGPYACRPFLHLDAHVVLFGTVVSVDDVFWVVTEMVAQQQRVGYIRLCDLSPYDGDRDEGDRDEEVG